MKKVKVLLYCTKAKPFLLEVEYDNQVLYAITQLGNADNLRINYKKVLNGKIVAECEVETEEIDYYFHYEPPVDIGVGVLPEFEEEGYVRRRFEAYEGDEELSTKTCLSYEQLDNYLKKKKGYALHISNLKIFDKPKRCQDDFLYQRKIEPNFYNVEYFRKAPQNMMKVIDAYGDDEYILISVRPEWLCKILNGEKTIEVRKKVLKEML